MSMTINGRTLDAEAVLKALQKHFGCEGNLDGDITNVIRNAYIWRKRKGINYHWKDVDRALHGYKYVDADLPEVVYEYYAEMVDPQARNAGRELGTAEVLKVLQSHFDLEGEPEHVITNVFKLCHLWDEHRGGYYRWQMVNREYSEYLQPPHDLPNCVYRYYAEVVHVQKPAKVA